MNTAFVSIGIDVSKHFLDVHGGGKGFPGRVANDMDGVNDMVRQLAGSPPDVIVCEPSGGYEKLLVAGLQSAGLPVVVVNARQIRDFARAKGVLAKTDTLDAKILSEYGAVFKPRPKETSRPTELAAYVSRRRQLVDMLRIEKQQHEKAVTDALKSDSEEHIAWLEDHIAELEARIREHITGTPSLQDKKDIITSCKGIGEVAAATLLAEMPELGAASHAQIAALAGLAPFNHDSGAMRGTRHIKGGRASVRHAIYMATIAAIRYNPDIKACYDRLRKNGKAAKVAIVACMRKLLITLNSLIRDNRKWSQVYVR
jgi:transposase